MEVLPLPRSLRRGDRGLRRPGVVDVLPVLVLLAGALAHYRHSGGLAGRVLSVAMALALLWRRRAPVPVFCLVWVLAAAQGLVARPTVADAALLVAFYTAATVSDNRTTLGLGLILEVGVVASTLKWTPGTTQELKVFVGLSGLATAAGVLGINIRNRRQIVTALRERARQLERGREREVALARATERGRIAREMHDVIAHNLSVMVALCDGAGYQVRDAPERVEAALAQATRAGRQALAEMRQLLGVLREPAEQSELAPLPGIRGIDELVERVRAAGLPVSYTLTGDFNGVTAGMELALYRIVQEALTNTLKHAGAGVTASVRLTRTPDSVEVEVRDSGRSGGSVGEGGGGVRGMRERAALYGGTLQAGPAADGGWTVAASLPLEPARVAAAP